MIDREESHARARHTAVIVAAFAFLLVFGVLVIASGDWVPGAVIAVASVVGLAALVRVIPSLRGRQP